MTSVKPDLQLPFQSQGITALRLVPNYYTAWCQKHPCVSKLPEAVIQQWNNWESNLQLAMLMSPVPYQVIHSF